MRRLNPGTVFLLKFLGLSTLALSIVAAAQSGGPSPGRAPQHNGTRKAGTFSGQIMDSKCATNASHEANMKRLGAKDARECTQQCAKDGSFILYDPHVYQLADQVKPTPFAGQTVKVTGLYDDWSQTIEIESIEAVP